MVVTMNPGGHLPLLAVGRAVPVAVSVMMYVTSSQPVGQILGMTVEYVKMLSLGFTGEPPWGAPGTPGFPDPGSPGLPPFQPSGKTQAVGFGAQSLAVTYSMTTSKPPPGILVAARSLPARASEGSAESTRAELVNRIVPARGEVCVDEERDCSRCR